MSRRKLERWLRRHGARFVRHGASHDIWRRGDRQTSVPRHTDIREGTVRSICDQLEIPPPA